MKKDTVSRKLKVILIILFIVLISLISFGGIFVQKAKNYENIIPEYLLGMDLSGARHITLTVSDETEDVIYDKDGNVVSEEGDDTTKKSEPVNSKDALTKENYEKSKEIVEERLDLIGVPEYTLRFDEENGKIGIDLVENSNTDMVIQYLYTKGEFTVEDEDGNVLLNNQNIEKAQVGYSTTTAGTSVYLSMHLNKEGAEKLKEMSTTYVKTTDEEGNDTTKNVVFKLDGMELISTYFEEEISSGVLQLSVGQASTDGETIQSYLMEASNLAVILNSGNMPLEYELSENRYVKSDITLNTFVIPSIIVLAIVAIGLIYLMIRYKKYGIISSVLFIGYVAILLLVLRFANVVLTLEGLIGIIIAMVLNYVFTILLLKSITTDEDIEINRKFNQAMIKAIIVIIPATIIAIVLCFAQWLPIYSFGMVMFWGIIIMLLYNYIFTKFLLVNITNNK